MSNSGYVCSRRGRSVLSRAGASPSKLSLHGEGDIQIAVMDHTESINSIARGGHPSST